MRSLILVFVAALAGTAMFVSAPDAANARKGDKFKRSERPIANKYIVVLEEDAASLSGGPHEAAGELTKEYRGRIGHIYTGAVKGYSVEMDAWEAERLSEDPRVRYVEEDGLVETQSVQNGATWGISRIDQRDRQYPLNTEYEYNATGAGVSVYVIDTGILTTHPDFGGRAVNGTNTSGDNTPVENCNGHGTHVAGTIGSNTYGVAKGVRLVSVRAFPCWGSTAVSNVVSALDWVSRNAVFPAVANMSLGGPASSTLDQAVQSTISRGVTVVAAAGNSNVDACTFSPARVPDAITVGMTDQRDYRDWVSNYGPCVDVFAPGVAIESLWSQGQYAYPMSGTSAAAPHAAGAAALYLETNPAASPQVVSRALTGSATPDILMEIGAGSPNLFLYSVFASGGETPCGGAWFDGALPAGGFAFQSSKTGFAVRSGTLSGRLAVPEGANFRLVLERKQNARNFVEVTATSGGNAVEAIDQNVRKGTYRWRVESLSGGGEYSLCSVVP